MRSNSLQIHSGSDSQTGNSISLANILLASGPSELPNDMIERRSEVVNDFTGQDTQSRNRGSLKNVLADFLKGFSILIRKDYVVPFQIPSHLRQCRYERRDLGIEITDILIGPC